MQITTLSYDIGSREFFEKQKERFEIMDDTMRSYAKIIHKPVSIANYADDEWFRAAVRVTGLVNCIAFDNIRLKVARDLAPVVIVDDDVLLSKHACEYFANRFVTYGSAVVGNTGMLFCVNDPDDVRLNALINAKEAFAKYVLSLTERYVSDHRAELTARMIDFSFDRSVFSPIRISIVPGEMYHACDMFKEVKRDKGGLNLWAGDGEPIHTERLCKDIYDGAMRMAWNKILKPCEGAPSIRFERV